MKYCPLCFTEYSAEETTCSRDQAALRVKSGWHAGMVIKGKYRILGKLGEGGMGSVYKALHTTFEETRALKVMHANLAENETFVRRFMREAKAARRLQHANTVRVEDFDQADDGSLFIVMEFVEGPTLGQMLKSMGKFPVPKAIAIARGVAEALSAAHALGMIHRDIKPANILMVTGTGGADVPKLVDFGIVALQDASTSLTSQLLLTPTYAAPEQFQMKSDEIDGRADLYSLGFVLYEMLTGRLPFEAASPPQWMLAKLMQTPPPPSRFAAELAEWPGVDEMVARLVASDREQRFASARAFLEAAALLERQVRTVEAETVVVKRVGAPALAPPDLAMAPPEIPMVPPQPPPEGSSASAEQGKAEAIARLRETIKNAGRIIQENEAELDELEKIEKPATEVSASKDPAPAPPAPAPPPPAAAPPVSPMPARHDSSPLELLARLKESGGVISMALDAKLRFAASIRSGAGESGLRLWKPASGEMLRRLPGNLGADPRVAFSPDGRFVAATFNGTAVQVWETATGAVFASVQHEAAVKGVAFSADSAMLFSASASDGRVFDLKSRTASSRFTSDLVDDIASLPDGRLLVAGGWGKTWVRVIDPFTGRKDWEAEGPGWGGLDLVPARDGHVAVRGAKVHVLELATGRLVRSIPQQAAIGKPSVALLARRRVAILRGVSVQILDATGGPARTIDQIPGLPLSIGSDTAGDLLIAAKDEGSVSLFRVAASRA